MPTLCKARTIFVLFCSWILWASTACAEVQHKRPRIGIIAPLSGAYAAFGSQIRAGIELAADNQVDLFFEDSFFDQKAALTAYKKLTSINQIQFLISAGGETCGVLNAEAQRDKIPHIAVGCNTAEFKNPDSYNYRLDVNEAIAADGLTRHLLANGVKRVALINIENAWGTIVRTFAQKSFEAARIHVTDQISFLPEAVGDLRSLLQKATKKSPDRLFIVASAEGFASVLRQLSELQIAIPVVSTIAVENPQFIELAGARTNGIQYLSVRVDPESKSAHPLFFQRFPDNNTFTAWGYDAVLLLRAAAPQTDPHSYLQTLKNFIGAFNVYNYDSTGELHLNYEMREIRNGSYIPLVH